MGLLDWLRGGGGELPPDSQEERVEIRSEETEGAPPELGHDVEPTAEEHRDSEAMRHVGL